VSRCAVGIGSNLGDRFAHLEAAVRGLAAVSTVVAVSSVYESAPVGGPEQGPYLNAVAVVDTAAPPAALLRELLIIERARGRIRDERWGPRTLDLDLLLCDRRTVGTRDLTLPHPRMGERRFVLDPLREVWPEAVLPDGSAVAPAGEEVSSQEIRRLERRIGAVQETRK
jgi:2-amino-4-hydroxy-6-hydroxymethyldihydropteridine diphosphokinase